MQIDDPITHWINGIKAGDEEAAAKLWERYSVQLLAIARRRLATFPLRVSDEEDVVLSTFDSLFQRARQGMFSQLNDRDDLWRLLITITHRKALLAVRRERTAKRGHARIQSQHDDLDELPISLPGREPTPELAAMMQESLAELLSDLDDEELRQIALWKLEQFTDAEIAAKIGRSLATVERRLKLIRTIWQGHNLRNTNSCESENG